MSAIVFLTRILIDTVQLQSQSFMFKRVLTSYIMPSNFVSPREMSVNKFIAIAFQNRFFFLIYMQVS